MTALAKLTKFAITPEQAEKMIADCGEVSYALKDVAVVGEHTVLYAAPNSGKTLFTQYLLIQAIQEENGIDPSKVFYINSDDSKRGAATKSALAHQHGYHMIAPNTYLPDTDETISCDDIIALLNEAVRSGECDGMVVILDTLKKFTDLMNKTSGKVFGEMAQAFCANGGTIISLAHVNKHRDADGKPIMEGTSDIHNDCNRAYIIDVIAEVADTTTVEFTPFKVREGDKVTKRFTYTRVRGGTYLDMLVSIIELTEETPDEIAARNILSQYREDAEIISTEMDDDISLPALLKKLKGKIGEKRTRKVLTELKGIAWNCRIGERGTYHYTKVAGAIK